MTQKTNKYIEFFEEKWGERGWIAQLSRELNMDPQAVRGMVKGERGMYPHLKRSLDQLMRDLGPPPPVQTKLLRQILIHIRK